MAANLKSVAKIAGSGKRFVSQIRPTDHHQLITSPALTFRRATHTSVYEKNPDDHFPPSVVQSDTVQPESDKYWAPHPRTGVFGPEAEHNLPEGGEQSFHTSSAGVTSEEEGKAWFRATHIEDMEKPH